jgi:steroid 5-alpha reductase family enzyme
VTLCLAAGFFVTFSMLIAWAVQRAVRNAGWVDVIWTLSTGLALSFVALAAPGVTWRHLLLAALLLIWAARLGLHVAWRVAAGPEDARYAQMREAADAKFQSRMFSLIIFQGPVSGLLAVSIYQAAAQTAPGFRLADLLGAALLLIALTGETLSDRQLHRWRAKPGHQNGICETGLWSLCRHPNYFFEALGWWAYPIIAFASHRPQSLLALIAPVLMFLVLRYLTGVPPLEAAMLARRGEAYRTYQARTHAMLPRI